MPKIRNVFDTFPENENSKWTATSQKLVESVDTETIYAEQIKSTVDTGDKESIAIPPKDEELPVVRNPLSERWIEEPKSSIKSIGNPTSPVSSSPVYASPIKPENNQIPGPPPISPMSAEAEEGESGKEKFEYIYGLRNISFMHKQYEENSISVSTPFEVEGNVMEVSLAAAEYHPIFDEVGGISTSQQTSVEYYVSYVPRPTLKDWHAILPEGQKLIKSERLLFDGKRTTELRFPASLSASFKPVIYKNGLVLENRFWTLVGNRTIQLQESVDQFGIYTIDYTPDGNPWTIDIAQQELSIRKQVDEFPTGTNHNKTVQLSKYPYVNYETIQGETEYNPNTSSYKPIEISIKNAQIAIPDGKTVKEVTPFTGDEKQEVYMYNRTNYKTGEWPLLKPYSLVKEERYKGLEYYQEGSKLIFTETFKPSTIYDELVKNHGSGTIVASYDYLVSTFRVKIILRRNTLDDTTVSPQVQHYTLKTKTMK